MKTKIKTFKTIGAIVCLAMLLSSAACQNKTGANKEGKSSKAAEIKPPQIDIHTAVVTGNLEAVQQHIAAGSNINAKDPMGGSTPLINATVFGKTDIAKALIDASATLNDQNNDGSTALHCAAFFCRPEIMKMLLDKGADKTIKNKYNATAYDNVAAPFKDMKPVYDMIGGALAPMGLKLDYAYIEKTRPEIASVLK
jgi:ankyrin repeat protein